jgi:hypothetical protein
MVKKEIMSDSSASVIVRPMRPANDATRSSDGK